MKRVVSLFLPFWPTDRLRRGMGAAAPPPEAPLVLIGREGRRRVVWAADASAQGLGLHPGIAAAQARALVSGLQVRDADPQADREALERLALWALRRYAPVVAADPPDGLVLDISGAAHLFGGEGAMLADMVARLAAAGVLARAAAADTWGGAHALARHRAAPALVVPPGRTGAALMALPVSALRLPGAMADELARLGLERIGELEGKPRAPLALRFGPELGRRLDQAFGRLAEPIAPVDSPELIGVRRQFAEPIGAPETLLRYTEKLTAGLCGVLEHKGLGARRLDLLFHRVDNRIQAVRIGTARPVRDPARLSKLLCAKLEEVEPGFGIEKMTLSAPVAEPLGYRQTRSDMGGDLDAALGAGSGAGAASADVSALLDTLANRLGAARLYRAEPLESDVPERAVGRAEPLAPAARRSWPQGWPRPARMFTPPEPVMALSELPDQPPVSFTWQGVRRRVRRADGPERIYGEWWKRDGEVESVRDYFQVEDERGERFWLFRRGDGELAGTGDLRWFLHGVFG